MSAGPLLVPMHADAMVENPATVVATPFVRFQMDYGRLTGASNAPQEDPGDPEPDPFTPGAPPAPGIYLHWTLPKALRHATHNTDTGATDFPLIPNRWLVSRIEAGAAPDRAVKSWILESDYLDPVKGSSPYLDPHADPKLGAATPTRIGRKQRLSGLSSLAVQSAPFLRAIGPGNVHFTVYSPGVMDVLAFYDDLTGLDDKSPVAAGTFSYNVVGWYSDPASDPLAKTTWKADSSRQNRFINDTFDWDVLATGGDLPRRMLVHALVPDLVWRRDADSAAPPNYPEHIPSTVRVAVGHTAIDALAAMLAVETGNESEGELLAAFGYGLLEHYDRAGSREVLAAERHRQHFTASSGGTAWSIVPAERGGDGKQAPAVVTRDQKPLLATLNTRQRELDRQQRILQSMQWNLRALWWKNRWQQQNNPPVDADFLTTQLPLQTGEASGGSPGGWYIDKVRAQKALVAQRTADVEAAKAAIRLDPKRQQLKARNAAPFHRPNDPVLLISGLGRSTNFDPVGDVTCRLATQTIPALTVGGTSYRLDSVAKRPLLDDPNHLLPDGVQQLHAEAVILSPQVFTGAIGAGSVDAVRQAYAALPAPAAGVPFAPPAYAAGPWQQPWVPLLLDWKVAVLRDPAYSAAPKQPTCTFHQERWQFNGTDYVWAGSTKAQGDDFSVADLQMTLMGRTFLTPYLSLTLADQLQEYLDKHKSRDPSIQALLDDTESCMKKLGSKDLLSQRLGGLLSRMVQRSPRAQAAPTGAIADAVGQTRDHPMPYPDEHASFAPAIWNFAPMGGTFFVIKQLSVIDSFGRTVDLMRANNSTAPANADSAYDSYFRPIVAADMKAVTTKDPGLNLGATHDLTERLVKLPPRLIQDSQLSVRLISNDAAAHDIELTAETTPVCGWVVANHLDRSLAFYAPDGSAWGELYLALNGKGGFARAWQPDPTNPQAPQSVDAIPNEFVRAILQNLWNRQDNGAGIDDFLRTIDETLWTVVPQGRRNDEEPAVVIGRPLAIVRAELTMRLRGLPYANQDWWNMFRDTTGAPDAPAEMINIDGGVRDLLWPVRIGSETLRHDGTIGYFADDPQTPGNSFAAFNAVALPPTATSNYVRQVGRDGNYPRLRPVDDSTATLDPKRNQVARLTLLVDPRCSVHAVTGLLPTLTLDIPREFVGPAIKRMAFTFRAGPLLTPPDALRIPMPAAAKGAWSWFDKITNAPVALAPADGRPRIAGVAPRAVEGWLKFVPDPPGSKDKS
jgi:hypothetical protein